MKKIISILLIMVLTLGVTGCSNTQKKDTQPDEIQYVSPIASHNKDIFVSLPMEYEIVENHVQINGLTTLNEIKVEVYDDAGTLLNENNTNIELFGEDGNLIDKSTKESTTTWKSFNKYLYFSKKPTTASGKVKIYSSENNYIEIMIKFVKRLEGDEQIKVIYPETDATQKGTIRVYGYASVYDGIINYKVKDTDENVLANGQIKSTSGAPDTGLFAKDISINSKSQKVILELSAKNLTDEKGTSNIEIPIQYQK